MKRLFFVIVFIVVCLPGGAQISSYGEFGLSLGMGRHLEHSSGRVHLGGTVHGMAGLQYGIVAINAGFGFIMLSDKASEPYTTSSRPERNTDVDFPLGLALRFPLDKAIIAVGADLSGFIGSHSTLMMAPHIDFLFAGKRVYRGIFIRGFSYLKQREPSYRPQYFGIGFKTTFG